MVGLGREQLMQVDMNGGMKVGREEGRKRRTMVNRKRTKNMSRKVSQKGRKIGR